MFKKNEIGTNQLTELLNLKLDIFKKKLGGVRYKMTIGTQIFAALKGLIFLDLF